MPPKKGKGTVVTNNAPTACPEIIPPLEVFMNIMAVASPSSTQYTQSSANPTEVGQLVFQLARDSHPRTCENFRLLMLGTPIPADKKPTKDQKMYSYVNTPFTRVTEDGIQGGNIHKPIDVSGILTSAACTSAPPPQPAAGAPSRQSTTGRGGSAVSPAGQGRSASPNTNAVVGAAITSKELGGGKNAMPESQLQSIYGPPFADEAKGYIPHRYGSLSMCNSGANTNGSQFFICTAKEHPTNYEITREAVEHLDRNYVCFGQLVEGEAVLELLASSLEGLAAGSGGTGDVTSKTSAPAAITYYIGSCGVVGSEASAALPLSFSPSSRK